MIWPSKCRHLKGLLDILALASFRRDDHRPYPTNPLFATEPAQPLIEALAKVWGCRPITQRIYRTDGIADNGPFFARTRADLLRTEANAHEFNATQRGTQQVSRNGYIECSNVDGLVEHLHRDVFHVGPSAIGVMEWAEYAIGKEEERLARRNPNPESCPPRVLVLCYRDGVLDSEQSSVPSPWR
jgi:hypothetical protein